MKNLYKIEDELYIISLSEKIKENTQSFKEGLNGDWFYNTLYNFIARTGDITPYDFKIILTTNNLLIKDGVQAIDDDFLEWFVKNPSCEFVEVADIWKMGIPSTHDSYQLIIPQEEPKQETLEEFIDKVDTPSDFDQFTFDEGIRVGAKWQAERMYSEEEVLKAQQAILGNIKDALQHKNYIIDYLKQLHEKKVL
jgi:hypothetical protein